MPRFFVPDIAGDFAEITGEDARHIAKSLRMRPGEELIVCDTRGYEYRCALEAASPGLVHARVLEKRETRGECRARIALYQALPKSDKLEFIVQKATELGVDTVVPVLSEHCVSRPDAAAMEKKRERLQKIALEAAKQSGRGKIPEIGPLFSFSEALHSMKAAQCAILCYEKATTPISATVRPEHTSFALLVGSEGGFSPAEAQQAINAGITPVSLGNRILRCETAPLCAIVAVLCKLGEL